MVGAGRSGRLTVAVTPRYAGAAISWADDAALAYEPLARHLTARAPTSLGGLRALDAGAGSGAAAAALREEGARVVAADLEFDMARYAAAAGPAVTADVTALPFRAGAFDIAVAAYVVNHLAIRRTVSPSSAG